MRNILIFLLIGTSCYAGGEKLPGGVTLDSALCTYAKGRYAFNFLKNNELVAIIQPESCYYSDLPGGGVNPGYVAEFYMIGRKDTFATKNEAMAWLTIAMEDYYKPVVFTKWQNLRVQPPKVTLRYPWDWSYRLDKYRGIFNSQVESENKLTLMYKDQRGQSEILMLIRTPNSQKLTLSEVMQMGAAMNRAIDFKSNPVTGITIGGKTFKCSQNIFMMQMQQFHFWYADNDEIIYINYNLLKDDRTRYPEVMHQIIGSISW